MTDTAQTIFVKRVLRDDLAITWDDGERVAAAITTDSGPDLTLDFAGITACAVPFFGALVGTRFDLFAQAKIVNLADGIESMYHRVIKNNREYFTDDRVRRAVDALWENVE